MARPLLGYYPVKRSDLYKDKELWTKTSGCLIKDFRHDEGRSSTLSGLCRFFYPSFLNACIRNPYYLKAFGFPIKDFGNDEKGITSFSTDTVIHASLIAHHASLITLRAWQGPDFYTGFKSNYKMI